MPGFIGFPELMLLAVVVLVIFGPKRLPEMGRSLGKGMREFKNSISGEPDVVHTEKFDMAALAADKSDEAAATVQAVPAIKVVAGSGE